MSTKDLFNKNNKVLTKSDSEKIKREIESFELIGDELESRKKIRPRVDYSNPENFAKYGSSVRYYEDCFARVSKTYPYDGSLSEKKKWLASSSDLDIWMLANVYPSFVGHVRLAGNQQVFVQGGPNKSEGVVEGHPEELSRQYPDKQGNSNIWNDSIRRNSNLYIDLSHGNTVEFWAKIDQAVIDAATEFKIFSLGNEHGEKYTVTYNTGTGKLRPTAKDDQNNICFDSILDYPSFIDATWNHYAFSYSQNSQGTFQVEIYKNGVLLETHSGIQAALVQAFSQAGTYLYINGGENAANTADGLYVDEFRYWKLKRTEKEIGRHWFTNVHGGTNTDDNKYSKENRFVDLGVYYRFNEGETGQVEIDRVALDYSGRISNAEILNYAKGTTRIQESAIDDSTHTDESEESSPLLYSSHPLYSSTLDALTQEAIIHDKQNNSSMYHTLPTWVTEEDSERGENLKNFTQILASFFDDLHLKISNLTELDSRDYYSLTSDTDRPSYLSKVGLSSLGLSTPDIFTEATLIEDILSRTEQGTFEEKIEDVRNTIYQNIYNNLSFIYKSKGTEKSFRNIIRCFGIDDEVLKINLYSSDSDYTVESDESSRRRSYTKKNFVDFNSPNRSDGIITSTQDASNPSISRSFVRGAGTKWNYLSSTLETEVIFPKKGQPDSPVYYETVNTKENILSVLDENDVEVLYVYAEKELDDKRSKNIRFKLGFNGVEVTTKYFKDVYDNSKFNLAFRIYPTTQSPQRASSTLKSLPYRAEIYCVRMLADSVEDEATAHIDLPNYQGEFISIDKYIKLGETSAGKEKTHKVSTTMFWHDYLSDSEIRSHAADGSNFGRERPMEIVYPHLFEKTVRRTDTLALHWDFNQVMTTDGNGEFFTSDLSDRKQSYSNVYSSQAVLFDNVNDAVEIGDPSNLTFADVDENGQNIDLPFSISAWINVPAGETGTIIGKYNGNVASEWLLWVDNGQLRVNLYDFASGSTANRIRCQTNVNGGVFTPADTWHHVVLTYDGQGPQGAGGVDTGINLYVNGTLVSQVRDSQNYVSMINTNTNVIIGNTDNGSLQFERKISNIAVFGKELDAQAVSDIYNDGIVWDLKDYYEYDSIISWWRLGDGDSSAANGIIDSVSENNGTLVNGASIVSDATIPSDVSYSGDLGWFTSLVDARIPAVGSDFEANDSQVTNREYVQSAKYRAPGVVGTEDLIDIGSQDYDVYTRNTKPSYKIFAIEKSMYQVIDDDILNLFASISEFNNMIGQPVNRYRMSYKSIQHFRQKYFQTIKNIPSLEKYVEYYKWIDTSIGIVIRDLVPVSMGMSADLRTVVESHMLERNKYWSKFPTLEMKQDPPEGQIRGIEELTYNWEQGHAPMPALPPTNEKAIQFSSPSGGRIEVDNSVEAFRFTLDESASDANPNLPGTPGYTPPSPSGDLPFSISAWCYVEQNPGATQVIVSKWCDGQGAGTKEYFFAISNTLKVMFILYDDMSGTGHQMREITTTSVPLNQWFHLTATYGASSDFPNSDATPLSSLNTDINIYLNGVQMPSSNSGSNKQYEAMPAHRDNYPLLTFGNTQGASLDRPFIGKLADISIFNKELSLQEVEELYNNGDVKNMTSYSAYNNIVGWWKMGEDQDTDLLAKNYITDDYHGTIINASIVDETGLSEPAPDPEDLEDRCLWRKERAIRTDAAVSTTGQDNPDSVVDTTRETLRKAITREVRGLSKVVERNGKFVEESRPVLATESGDVYEGGTYATRRLSKPYNFGADIVRTIKSGVNYSEITKDPNTFIRSSTNLGNSIELGGLVPNPQECLTDLSKRKYKRSSKITISQQSLDGSFIFPYYGESIKDSQAEIKNLHNDSYGNNPEIPIQGPFTDTWVGGNQHRHVNVGQDTDRPELYIQEGQEWVHPHDASPAQASARYTREEFAKRPVNIKNIRTVEDSPIGNYDKDYQVVSTTGRAQNNRWFIRNNGQLASPTPSPHINGLPDYALPERGRTEHVFVQRFSAPGDPNTLSRGQLDRISEEYSVYNSVNYRNLDDREVYQDELKTHNGLFEGSQGYEAGTAGKASVHKVNRNRAYEPSGNKYDNAYVNFQIPRSAEQYNVPFESGIVYEEKFEVDGYITQYSDWSWEGTVPEVSSQVLTLSTKSGSNVTDPPTADLHTSVAREQEFLVPVSVEYTINELAAASAGEDLYLQYKVGNGVWETEEVFLAKSVGSNYTNSRHLNYFDYNQEEGSPLKIRWVAKSANTTLQELWSIQDIKFTTKDSSDYEDAGVVVRGQSDVEYSDYQAGGWRLIRNAEKNSVIRQRSSNTISILDKPPAGKRRADTFTSHVEPAAVWHKPLRHEIFPSGEHLYQAELNLLRSQDRMFTSEELRFAKAFFGKKVVHSYSNNLEVFSNPNLSKKIELKKTSNQFFDEISTKITLGDVFLSKLVTTEVVYPKRRNVGLAKVRYRPFFDTYKSFWKEKHFDRIKKDKFSKTKMGYDITDLFRQMFRQQYSVYSTDNYYYTEVLNGAPTINTFQVIGDLSYIGENRYKYNMSRKDYGFGYIPGVSIVLDNQYGLKGFPDRDTDQFDIPRFFATINADKSPVPSPQLHYGSKQESQGWVERKTLQTTQPTLEYDYFSEVGRLAAQNYAILPEFCISEHMEDYIINHGGNFYAKNHKFLTLRGASYDSASHTLDSSKKKEGADFFSTRAQNADTYSYKVEAYPLRFDEDSLIKNCAEGLGNFNKIVAPSTSTYELSKSEKTKFRDSSTNKYSRKTFVPPVNTNSNPAAIMNAGPGDNDFFVVGCDNIFTEYEEAKGEASSIRLAGANLNADGTLTPNAEGLFEDATPVGISIWAQPTKASHQESSQAIFSFGHFYDSNNDSLNPDDWDYDSHASYLSPNNATLFSKFVYSDRDLSIPSKYFADAVSSSFGLTFVLGNGHEEGYTLFNNSAGNATESEIDTIWTNAWTFFNKDGTPSRLEEGVLSHIFLQILPTRGQDDTHPQAIRLWLNGEPLVGVHVREFAKYTTLVNADKSIVGYDPCPIGGGSLIDVDTPWHSPYSTNFTGQNGLKNLTHATHFVLGNGSFHNTFLKEYGGDTFTSLPIERKFTGFLNEFVLVRGVAYTELVRKLYNKGEPQNYSLFVNAEGLKLHSGGIYEYRFGLSPVVTDDFSDAADTSTNFTLFGSQIQQEDPVANTGPFALSFNGSAIDAQFFDQSDDIPYSSDNPSNYWRGARLNTGIQFQGGTTDGGPRLTDTIQVSFDLYESPGGTGDYGITDVPEPPHDKFYLQYNFNSYGLDLWETAIEVEPKVTNGSYWNGETFSATISLPEGPQFEQINIRFLTRSNVAGANYDHWAIRNFSVERHISQTVIVRPSSSADVSDTPSPGLVEYKDEWTVASIPDRQETKVENYNLAVWHRLGIEKVDADCYDWDDEFFNSYVHTNTIPFIESTSSLQGIDDASRTVRLKVDAIKKLLPYDGFYPQDRTVQLAELFVRKLDGVESFVETRHESYIYKTQSVQAIMQHFFAPGILYNTLKSGIACDWASYSNVSGWEPPVRYNFAGYFTASDASEMSGFYVQNQPVPSWYMKDRPLLDAENATPTLTQPLGDAGTNQTEQRYATSELTSLSLLFENVTSHDQLRGSLTGAELYTDDELEELIWGFGQFENRYARWEYDASQLGSTGVATNDAATRYATHHGSLLTKEPDYRLPFEAILNPVGFLQRQGARTKYENVMATNGDGPYSITVTGKPSQYFLMTPEYTNFDTDSGYVPFSFTTPNYQGVANDEWVSSPNRGVCFPYFDAMKIDAGSDSRYELAINNFLAEVPRFFLANESLTTITSKKEKDFIALDKDTTYYMYVSLFRSKDSFSPVNSNSNQGLGSHYFGPSMLWKEDIESELDFDSESAHAAYVPPYLYGGSMVKLQFKPDESRKHSLTEIFAGLEYEDMDTANQHDVFRRDLAKVGSTQSYEESPAWKSRMPVTSSIEVRGKMIDRQVTYDVFGNPIRVEDPVGTENDVWAIYPRFESPILNFYSTNNSSSKNDIDVLGLKQVKQEVILGDYTYTATPTDSTNNLDFSEDRRTGSGLWSGYGEQDELGVYISVSQDAAARDGELTGEQVNGVDQKYGSLIDVCGFREETVQLGLLQNTKKISEAVVMIPFLDEPLSEPIQMPEVTTDRRQEIIEDLTVKVDDRNFIRVSEFAFNNQMEKYKRGLSLENPSYTLNGTAFVTSSITRMIAGMNKYNIPPRYDFLKNGGKPFAMYFFEFEHTLTKQDLENIWQGLPPEISNRAVKDSVEVEHPINGNEFFGGMADIPKNIRWMVFKVKRKASIDYYEMTADSTDDERFKFDFRSRGNVRPEYSYNYPYDFFTMLDRVKIEASTQIDASWIKQYRKKYSVGEDGFDGIQE